MPDPPFASRRSRRIVALPASVAVGGELVVTSGSPGGMPRKRRDDRECGSNNKRGGADSTAAHDRRSDYHRTRLVYGGMPDVAEPPEITCYVNASNKPTGGDDVHR